MAQAYTSAAAIKSHSNITDTNADSRLGAIATAVNEMFESYIGGPVGDGGTVARTFDISSSTKWVPIRHGIRPGTTPTVEYASSTGGDFTAVASGNVVWRPADWDRPTDWPAMELWLVDGSTPSRFSVGYDTVRITPDADGGWGWASVPADLSQVALIAGLRMFQSSQSGESLSIGSTEFGAAIIRFLPEPEYQAVLERYRTVISPSWVA
jgi:hypothetical protein